jgi:hypothetical protein
MLIHVGESKEQAHEGCNCGDDSLKGKICEERLKYCLPPIRLPTCSTAGPTGQTQEPEQRTDGHSARPEGGSLSSHDTCSSQAHQPCKHFAINLDRFIVVGMVSYT